MLHQQGVPFCPILDPGIGVCSKKQCIEMKRVKNYWVKNNRAILRVGRWRQFPYTENRWQVYLDQTISSMRQTCIGSKYLQVGTATR